MNVLVAAATGAIGRPLISALVSARHNVFGITSSKLVDDDPSVMSVWLPAFAASVGAPEPQHISEREALEQTGPDAVYYATQLRGASNAKARRDLAFAPRRLEWLARTKTASRA
jgi:hypothetical protein